MYTNLLSGRLSGDVDLKEEIDIRTTLLPDRKAMREGKRSKEAFDDYFDEALK
jgi:hypothetical protein